MDSMKHGLATIVLLLSAASSHAEEGGHSHVSSYAGEEARIIKSLSPKDIEELRSGGGWGLAKAAELNGVPGPLHLLEMQDEIPLTDSQVDAIESLYRQMKAEAIDQGLKLIALERELEMQFQSREITDSILLSLLGEIADARRNLRYIHLATHLRTPDILSEEQIEKYNRLRGYAANSDPCANVPEGHNATLWRWHNGCD